MFKTRLNSAGGLTLGLILVLSPLSEALGQSYDASSSEKSAWTFSFTTYSWLPWLTGDAAIRGRSFDVDLAPDDVLRSLDWSTIPVWMSTGELRNGKFTLISDIVYSATTGSAGFERSRQGPFLSATVRANIDADYQQTVVELGGAYEVWANGSQGSTGHSALELLAGGRYWRQELDLSVAISASAALRGPLGLLDLKRSGGRLVASSGSVDWVDPFVGARMRYDVDKGQWLTIRGDVGGFGAGSDFSWQTIAAYNWQVCLDSAYEIDAYIGYRALSVDYSEGNGNKRYEYDVIQHGPVMGLSMQF